jgi:hypothetical protein
MEKELQIATAQSKDQVTKLKGRIDLVQKLEREAQHILTSAAVWTHKKGYVQ